MSASNVRFEETQRFRQPWLWILIWSLSLSQVALIGHGMYQQLYLGRPWGNNPASDRTLVIIGVFVFIMAAALPLLFHTMRLTVRVAGGHLHIRFFPFIRKTIPLDRIVRCEARTYNPLRDYGGWGIRWSWMGKGWAYNISGNRGVQLELTGGGRLMIGSQRPEQLANAITAGKEH